VLVKFEPDFRIGLMGLSGLELQLSGILRRKVYLPALRAELRKAV